MSNMAATAAEEVGVALLTGSTSWLSTLLTVGVYVCVSGRADGQRSAPPGGSSVGGDQTGGVGIR